MDNLLDNIYNILKDPVLVINDDYSIDSINESGKKVFRINENQLINNKCYELICKKEQPATSCPINCIKNNPCQESQYYLEFENRSFQVTSQQITTNSDSPKYIGVFHDVTEFVTREKELQEIKEEYETLNEEYLCSIEELEEKNELVFEEKQKFEQLFSNMNSACALHEIILDKNGNPCDYRFIECNPMFEKQTGLKSSDILNKTVLEVIPGIEKYWIEAYGRVALGGKPIRFTEYSKDLDKYFETFTYSPKEYFFAVIFNDVTENKKNEEELNKAVKNAIESEAKFRAAFLTSPDAININAMDGTYIEINNGFTALTGYTREEVIGISSLKIDIWAIPEDREKLITGLNKSGKIENLESIFRCKDGSYKTALMSASIITINNNPQILSITRDITEKKIQEKKLQVKNNIASSFAITDNNIVFQNVLKTLLDFFQCKYGFFGYINSDGDLECPTLTHLVWDKFKSQDKKIVFKKENWGGVWGESLLQKKNIIKNKNLEVPHGHLKIKNTLAVVIADKDNLFGQIVLGEKTGEFNETDKFNLEEFCQYILPLLKTFLKEQNYKQEIIEARDKAEKADLLKSSFLANMSHEIRTPLNGIMGFTDLLVNQSNVPEEQKSRYASIIIKSSETLINIVNDILDISSIESGNFSLFKRPFDLNKCLHEQFNLFTRKISESNKDIILNHKTATGRIIVDNDENRLRQVFANLLDNAIKFTEKGEIQFGLSEIKDNKFVFFVSDTGIGIPAEKHKIIFDRFRQVENTTTRLYGGNGLGLSIVRELIHLMGGEIWLESVPDKGSTFFFTLPNTSKSIKADDTEFTPFLNKNNISINALIVEDDAFNAQYLEELMLGIKANYTICSEGQAAINEVKNNKFDIVLMDIQLPDISGYEAVKEIRKFNRDIIIIAQTAFAMQHDEEKAIAAGCNAYISKPIKKNDLLKKIETTID